MEISMKGGIMNHARSSHGDPWLEAKNQKYMEMGASKSLVSGGNTVAEHFMKSCAALFDSSFLLHGCARFVM